MKRLSRNVSNYSEFLVDKIQAKVSKSTLELETNFNESIKDLSEKVSEIALKLTTHCDSSDVLNLHNFIQKQEYCIR